MNVQDFCSLFVNFAHETIVPQLPWGYPRGAATACLALLAAEPQKIQDLVGSSSFAGTMGLVKDGVVDVKLATAAIEGFFVGGNKVGIPLSASVLIEKFLKGKVERATLENSPCYELTEAEARKFCDILKAHMRTKPMTTEAQPQMASVSPPETKA